MYSEVLRKITSLTLLTILLTSTAAFAMPNALPQAHASTNANLFVSAENSQFNNYFAGPQVIQVVVSDPAIQRLDQNYGEPTVNINGKKLRMAQATDGNWYAYFADRDQAIAADKTAPLNGTGLNFGQFCSSASSTPVPSGFTETKGFTVARQVPGSVNQPASSDAFGTCTNFSTSGAILEHVVRQSKQLNTVTAGNALNIPASAWPIIQLYDFGGSDPGTVQSVAVDYQKAGGDQISTLTFSRIPTNLINTSLDRTVYPQSAQVFIAMKDPQLNIDPTEEDSWTFGGSQANPQLFYQAFDRNGNPDADKSPAAMVSITNQLTALMFNHNGLFTLNPISGNGQLVVDSQSNGKQTLITAFATPPNSADPFNLGAASSFGVLGSTTVTNDPTLGTGTVITGNLGLSPGTSVTGFPPGIVTGIQHITDTLASQAHIDALTAYNAVNASNACTNPAPWPGGAGNQPIGGLTLGPGVYCSTSSISIAGSTTLTLSGAGTYIFKAPSTLTTVTNANVVLTNGANANNIIWLVGSSATLAAPNPIAASPKSFEGTIIAIASISETGGTTGTILNVDGRLLALNGAVTFASSTKVTTHPTGGPVFNPTAATTPSGVPVEPVTFIEVGGVNTGNFGNWDGSKIATLITDAGAIRGQSATFRYNDVSSSIVGGFGFASMSVTPVNGTWPSGQKIPVTLVDTDQNKNSKITEHLANSNPNVVVPSMTIGTPFSASQAGATVTLIDPAPITLGLAGNFAILASTYTNTAGGVVLTGDLGYTTGPAVAPTVTGVTHVADAAYSQAGTDQGVALPVLNGEACTFTFATGAVALDNDTTHGAKGQYAPGVYCGTGVYNLGTGGITLNGAGHYNFRNVGALNTFANSAVSLSGGADASNVFWTPTGATTLGANSVFKGTDIDNAGITIGGVVTWVGRALDFATTVSTGPTVKITVPTGPPSPNNPPAISPTTGIVTGLDFRSFGSFTGATSGDPHTLAVPTDPLGNRLLFQPANGVSINSGIVIDTHQTMATLLKTIHDTRPGNAETFKGFNFVNYDIRSVQNALKSTSGQITAVNVILLYEPTGLSIIDPVTGNVRLTVVALNMATSSSLEDLINISNLPGLATCANPAKAALCIPVANTLFTTIPKGASIGLLFNLVHNAPALTFNGKAVVVSADFFSFGITGDGKQNNQRVNNAIYRYEVEETGDNTSTFTGTTEYVMLNQLNILDPATYAGNLRPITHDVKFVAIQDMLRAESRAPQISYFDIGSDGQTATVSAQQDILTHTGVVSFDSKTYKIADTVTITLNDKDLNVDNDLVDIYTVVPSPAVLGPFDAAAETVGKTGLGFYTDGSTAFGRLLDIQFGQQNTRWMNTGCFTGAATAAGFNLGLTDTGFSLVETGPSTGIFTGTFEIPDQFCNGYAFTTPNTPANIALGVQTLTSVGSITSTVGQNIKVNYVDFRDESGKLVEVSDNAGVRGNTGSITLDKSVYPVAFGSVANGDFAADPAHKNKNGVFPLHRDVFVAPNPLGIAGTTTLSNGDTLVHIRVNDQDYNTSPAGTDHIAVNIARGADATHGPVWATISRQSQTSLIATAGASSVNPGRIVVDPQSPTQIIGTDVAGVRELGPMTEIAPDAGIFQADLPVRFTDGPAAGDCPKAEKWQPLDGTTGTLKTDRFVSNYPPFALAPQYCVRQGDVLTVYYNDTNDASGHQQILTDSATFDLRNGVLQSDKSVYIIGSDMILTLVEPDLNLDSQQSESAPLDLIEWDSHAFKGTMGPLGGASAAFDAKPSTFVETGKDTGIFQSVIKIPKQLGPTLLERGEQIHLEYTDWGPAGSKTVGANNQDIQLTIYTSNFGATVELDQKVYTWTDRVYITVVAPDHNFDPNLIDTIGDGDSNKVTVSTRGNSIPNTYRLVESGVDTGIFTGYVILTGNALLKSPGGVDGAGTEPTQAGPSGNGPTDGFLPSEDSDGVSVSFEFTRDQTVTGSALIRWNIGETKWLQASYPANGQGVLQVVDPDVNLNPKAIDKFDTNVWSDSDSGGIKLTMTETGDATGIFQGTVYFTTNFQSSGNRLHVAEGDTVTGEYKDRTLPAPYTPADQLRLTSTTFIGTVVPPLERAPASNPRIVDSFGNALTSVKVNQQIQITADLTNGQDRDQPFAYLVQIQDANGVTVSLSWLTGALTGGQSLNPAQSWTPTASGTYTAQIFVWQGIDNPNPLSPPLSKIITVV